MADLNVHAEIDDLFEELGTAPDEIAARMQASRELAKTGPS